MGKDPDHQNPHCQFFLNDHPHIIAGSKPCGICNKVYIVIKVLHNLTDGCNPNKNLKESKNRSNIPFPLGNEYNTQCANRYVTYSCQKNQKGHNKITEQAGIKK